MNTRTWPFGTRKTLSVLCVSATQVIGVDEANEGHIITGVQHAVIPEQDRKYVMEFTAGGPNGGYWRIIGIPVDQRLQFRELLEEAYNEIEPLSDGTADATPLARWANDWSFRVKTALQ